ncbi:DUF1146 domain-containing protein [Alicyclobacillus tolerans]|uniref:DUF1146 domain-containing protein n=1 Tax=Alicyclobacillus tolerans TaxID=90970 RepID=UPI001F212B6F|nr:DUF1146 domain-containing protein [Alicyclobacillus tolerans]MCF8567174.1 DUF1146 domain-containing protein [Alicyclobacillus tolerans]
MGLNAAATYSNAPLYAADGLIFIIAFLGGVYITWWAVGILKWDKFTADPHGPQARMLRFLMALTGGLLTGLVAVAYLFAGQALRMIL